MTKETAKRVLAVVLVAALFRLAVVLALGDVITYDIDSFEAVAHVVETRQDLYEAPELEHRYPYLPFHAYLIGLTNWTAKATGIPFTLAIRLLPLIADV